MADADVNPMDKYKTVRTIGKGTFGTALLVESNGTGKRYVLKRIRLARMTKEQRDAANLEMELLAKLHHSNVIAYKEAWVENGHTIFIVTLYCSRGDLLSMLRRWRGPPPDDAFVIEILVQLLSALAYVHDRNIIHRDVKSSNVFLTEVGLVQLGDFGLAARIGAEDDATAPGTMVGTPNYMAPEVISELPHGRPCDVWSLGCVTYEMMALKPAFAAFDLDGLIKKVKTASAARPPARFSRELKSIVAKMLSKNPADRPTCLQILDDRWIKAYVPLVTDKVDRLGNPLPTERLPPLKVTVATRNAGGNAPRNARRGPAAVLGEARARIAAHYAYAGEPRRRRPKLAPIDKEGMGATDEATPDVDATGRRQGTLEPINQVQKGGRRKLGGANAQLSTRLRMYDRNPAQKKTLRPIAPELATLRKKKLPELTGEQDAQVPNVLSNVRKRVLAGPRPMLKRSVLPTDTPVAEVVAS